MFSSALSAGLRHLKRNRAYAAISVGGLAIGLCAALLAGIVIRNQYTFDRDVPGYERTYAVLWVFAPPGLKPTYGTITMLTLADELRVREPSVEATARVLEERQVVKNGNRSWRELVYWADPDFARTVPLKTIAGDAEASLRSPDGVILMRSAARRFFGTDAPLGATLTIGDHPMTVRAIIADPGPTSSHEVREIIASGIASFSITSRATAGEKVASSGNFNNFTIVSGYTYVRLKPGAEPSRAAETANLITESPKNPVTSFVRIDQLNVHEGLHPGVRERMTLLGVLGLVVLLIASVNFVNLQTARSARRAREVAIRKVAGAHRGALIVQFMGESLLYALLAGLIALALAEWLLPYVNAFLETGAQLDYVREPGVLFSIIGITALLGLLAGIYPACIASAFRPASLLSSAATAAPGGMRVRQCLVATQFALMIGLGICAGVVYLQRQFALTEGLRVNGEQVLMVADTARRRPGLDDELRALPGVRSVVRASSSFLGRNGYRQFRGGNVTVVQTKAGDYVSLNVISADFRLFDFYGVKPLAGTLPRATDPEARTSIENVVINETLMRRFSLGPPEKAVGTSLPMAPPGKPIAPENPAQAVVRAVVPDFSLGPVSDPIPAIAYFENESQMNMFNLRLTGRDIPETLAAIDSMWKRVGEPEPPLYFFLDDHLQRQYVGVLRQSQAFGACAAIAIGLSCLGLFALTAATAERRTREIGVRKALGAQTTAIVRLLLWQFTRPVLWAVLLAWPAAAWVMNRWLQEFAYRIDLPFWLFPLAAALALIVAVLTVTLHTLAVARTRPAVALRYE